MRDGDPHREQRPAVEVGAGGAQPHEERPVVEVHAVADEAEGRQRLDRQQLAERARGRLHRRGDDDRGGHRARQQAAAVEVRRLALEREGRGGEEQRGADAGHLEDEPGATGGDRAQQRGQRRQGDAGEDGEGPRVGAVVDAVGAVPGVERQRQERRHGTEHHRGDEDALRHGLGRPGGAPPPHGEQAGDDQRPDHVELLLDREAPRVVERRRRGEERPVVVAREHRPPVGHVGDRGEGVHADEVQLLGRGEERGIGRHPEQHHAERREEPPRPSGPEGPEVHVLGRADLREQQAGDEEAGQDEEGVDAQVAAVEVAAVEQQHAGDGGAADAVERADVADARPRPVRGRDR